MVFFIQPDISPIPENTSLEGKTVIVTGATSGIGYEAARQLLVCKASRVILAIRSKSKGEEAVKTLLADPEVKKNNPDAKVEVFELVLDSYDSVTKFADRVKREVEELDIVLNNAGIAHVQYTATGDGHEQVMQVNAYSQVLIALLLLPLLRSTAAKSGEPSRITFTSSRMHKFHTFASTSIPDSSAIIPWLDSRENYAGKDRYANSKVCLEALSKELAKRVPREEVIINTVCPGFTWSNIDLVYPIGLKQLVRTIRRLTARTTEVGTRVVVKAAIVHGPDSHGEFVNHDEIDRDTPFLHEDKGKKFQEKLWAETVQQCAKVDSTLAQYK